MKSIYGSFADYKTIKTRAALQLIIEVPIEQSKHVLNTLGFPLPGEEIPVVVTLVQLEEGDGGDVTSVITEPSSLTHEEDLS